MDDGYYQLFRCYRSRVVYSTVPLFDEYDQKLGRAISPPPTAAWKSGIYRRDFENGIVLVNPRGNGAVTVDLEKEYKRIAGNQDPAVNNGQTTKRVSLKDRDGLVLLNLSSVVRPKAPAQVTSRIAAKKPPRRQPLLTCGSINSAPPGRAIDFSARAGRKRRNVAIFQKSANCTYTSKLHAALTS